MFEAYPKIPRWSKDIVITEKIDGTNAQIYIVASDSPERPLRDVIPVYIKEYEHDTFLVYAGSRNHWLNVSSSGDNFGFAKWVETNGEELVKLGEGRHFGEWWGLGIQRGYGLAEKRFSLFNAGRWHQENTPACCQVVPVLYSGPAYVEPTEEAARAAGSHVQDMTMDTLRRLSQTGSIAAPGYMNPEGIIIYHTGSNQCYKKTFEQDGGKWSNEK